MALNNSRVVEQLPQLFMEVVTQPTKSTLDSYITHIIYLLFFHLQLLDLNDIKQNN